MTCVRLSGAARFRQRLEDRDINPHLPIKGTFANSVDPDQTPQNAASDQDLHSLH